MTHNWVFRTLVDSRLVLWATDLLVPAGCPQVLQTPLIKLNSISFTSVKWRSLSVVSDFVTLWTVDHQSPLSMGFSRQEYWSGLSRPSPGDLPNPGIEPGSLCIVGRWFTVWATSPFTWVTPPLFLVPKCTTPKPASPANAQIPAKWLSYSSSPQPWPAPAQGRLSPSPPPAPMPLCPLSSPQKSPLFHPRKTPPPASVMALITLGCDRTATRLSVAPRVPSSPGAGTSNASQFASSEDGGEIKSKAAA